MPGEKRWIFVNQTDDLELDPTGHGTCVLSKAAGSYFGVARNANIVLVKIPEPTLRSDVWAAMAEVSNDISHRRLQGKAVINFSSGSLWQTQSFN